ncbi:MAG: GAF domain-containing protein [Anaerolineales bacterium]|nr:GAF domain-containing protein [Anaerolineales bacterium]
MEPIERHRRINRLGDLIVIGANICGALLAAFFLTNLQASGATGVVTMGAFEMGVLLAVSSALLVLGNLTSGRRTKHLMEWHLRLLESPEALQVPERIQRLALGLPATSGLTNLAMWFVAGLSFSFLNGADFGIGRIDWGVFFQTLLGAWIAGVITAVLVFFAVERVWRRELPLFFPGGDPTGAPGFRVSVRLRMIILFTMGTMPLIYLAALSYSQAVQIAYAGRPAELLPRMLFLDALIACTGVGVAILLARTLGASLVEPLEDLSRRMNLVSEGDLDTRAVVASNDEIGALASHFNSMLASLRRRQIELHTIYQVSQDITASLELERTLCTVLERVRQIIDYTGGRICLYDERADMLEARARMGSRGMQIDASGRLYRPGEGYPGWVAARRRGLLVPDLAALDAQEPSPRHLPEGVESGGYLGVPLVVGQKLVGVLELVSADAFTFDEHARQLLEAIAPQAAIAIQNAAQVLERERALKEQIEQLRIEIDESRRQKQVQAITGTEYYRQLRQTARQMRRQLKGEDEAEN